jgi:phosphatidylcholine synthase
MMLASILCQNQAPSRTILQDGFLPRFLLVRIISNLYGSCQEHAMTEVNFDHVQISKRLSAWGVHLFTASGTVWGLLAIIAIWQHQWQTAFVWMGVASAVDSLDGTLARRFEVKGRLPGFDGALLDNIVDYLTYVIIPALLLYEAGLLPVNLALVGAATVVLTSAFQFCQTDAKTDDYFFKGFPSYWNVIVFYLFALNLSSWFNLAVIMLCGVLVFVPLKYIYPSRTKRFQRLTLWLTITWGLILLITLVQYPAHQRWLLWASLFYVVYYIGVSLYLTIWPDTVTWYDAE